MIENEAVKNAIETKHTLYARPRLYAEWNHNRFTEIESIDTAIVSQDKKAFDPEIFPIKSIVEPNRPSRSRLVKARVDKNGNIPVTGSATGPYTFQSPSSPVKLPYDADVDHYYVTSVNDYYKYWCSAEPTKQQYYLAGGGSTGAVYFATKQVPTVIYKEMCMTNKIVITFENGVAAPSEWTVDISEDGTTWETIDSNRVVPPSGRIELYHQFDGTWSPTIDHDGGIPIKGLRITVSSMTKPDSYLEVIEMSPRYEMDLSDKIIDMDYSASMSETSFAAPIGELSSNEASVTLDNFDGAFNREANDDKFFLDGHQRFIDKNVKMTGFISYDVSPALGDDIGYHEFEEDVRLFTMYVDGQWAGQGEEQLSLNLKDYSTFFQGLRPPKVLYENLTAAEIIWRLCDLVGFVDYEIDLGQRGITIPYFWADGEKTLWELFSEIAEATQTAVYFDAYGILHIRNREKVSGEYNTIDWPLTYDEKDGKLPEIIDLNSESDFDVNKVKVKYHPTTVETLPNGLPKNEIVWEPEDTMTLRASQITYALLKDETERIRIPAKDAEVWPYSAVVQINGELIRYRAKGYYYWEGGTRHHGWVENEDEKKALDDKTPDLDRVKNHFSGHLVSLQRGLYGTKPTDHYIDAKNYSPRITNIWENNTRSWTKGLTLERGDGYMKLKTNNTFHGNHLYVATRGSYPDAALSRYGTRLRFPTGGSRHGAAGIIISSGQFDSGFYIELTRTSFASRTRDIHNEVTVYTKRKNGDLVRFGKGKVLEIAEGKWYNLDVYFRIYPDDTRHLYVMVDGVPIAGYHWKKGSKHDAEITGRFGVFVRGWTSAHFEYLYGVYGQGEPGGDKFDESEFDDLITGGYTTNPMAEFTYRTRTTNRMAYGGDNLPSRYKQVFFDEFAPIVHEVREMDVEFEDFPVTSSSLYYSNERVVTPEYMGDPFGAKFWLANSSRVNEVLNGEDTLTFGADNPVDQKIMIHGSLVKQEDEQEYEVINENGRRIRGEIETEISSPWIQSEDQAKSIGEWIVKHWGMGNDELQVEVFGNPLFELLDTVTIDWPNRDLSPGTHKYYIVGIQQSWEDGLSTNLTLRRGKYAELGIGDYHFKPILG